MKKNIKKEKTNQKINYFSQKKALESNSNNNKDRQQIFNKRKDLTNKQKIDIKNLKQENSKKKKLIIQEYKTQRNGSKNLKNIYKSKLIKKLELTKLKTNLSKILKDIKLKNKDEIRNLKLELINKKYPLFTEKDKSNRLLLEKIKNKKSENIKKEKTNWKIVFKELPLRMFKEVRRVQWGSSDAKIGWKFVSVILFIVICALFIFGIETALTALLKLMKISLF